MGVVGEVVSPWACGAREPVRTVVDEGLPRRGAPAGPGGRRQERFIDQFVRHMPLSPPPVVYRGRCLAYGEGITDGRCARSSGRQRARVDDPAAEAAAKLNARVGHVREAAESRARQRRAGDGVRDLVTRESARARVARLGRRRSRACLAGRPTTPSSQATTATSAPTTRGAGRLSNVPRQRLQHWGDSCKYMSTDSSGDTTKETLQQSMTLSSRTPICTDVSASTTENKPVTVQLACTNPSNSQLNYFLATQPRHAALGRSKAAAHLYAGHRGSLARTRSCYLPSR